MNTKYQICTKCVMDTSDVEITFDKDGICNHCLNYNYRAKNELHLDEVGQIKLQKIIDIIKKEGKNKDYDCIIGVSGGVDSTYLAYLVKQLGLRPLAVHFDNGWDSELAVMNIENTLKVLGIDLYTKVVDWEEFKELQLSFLKSSITNAEIPTDHAINAILLEIAAKNKIRYIILGGNVTTEAILPQSFGYDNKDAKIIRSIHSKFSKGKLKTYPMCGLVKLFYYIFIKRIKFLLILNYFNYNKSEAMKVLKQELGWRSYGDKHSESIYTRFFQNYILPKKYGIDKRRAHLSTLINSGQLTREEALRKIYEPPCSEQQLTEDLNYVVKKLGLDRNSFNEIMLLPPKSYKDYPSNSWFFLGLKPILAKIKRLAIVA